MSNTGVRPVRELSARECSTGNLSSNMDEKYLPIILAYLLHYISKSLSCSAILYGKMAKERERKRERERGSLK